DNYYYMNGIEWTKEVGVAEAYSGANKYTGWCHSYSHAWAGESDADSRMEIRFVIGRNKQVTVKAKTISFGGTLIVPPASVAGTYASLDVSGKYYTKDIDSPFGFDWFAGVLLWYAQALGYSGGADIVEMLEFIEKMNTLNDIRQFLMDMEDKKIVSITKTRTLSGLAQHVVKAGIRTRAVGAVAGEASAIRAGIVDYIYVDGIHPPDKPTVKVENLNNRKVKFTLNADDVNNDPIERYFIRYGNGDGEFVEPDNGDEATVIYQYPGGGEYDVEVIAIDCDDMQSEKTKTSVGINYDKPSVKLVKEDCVLGIIKSDEAKLVLDISDSDSSKAKIYIDWGDGDKTTKTVSCGKNTFRHYYDSDVSNNGFLKMYHKWNGEIKVYDDKTDKIGDSLSFRVLSTTFIGYLLLGLFGWLIDIIF
ncbi:MAG: hypothetical protein ACOC5T_08270, partial [Elusimicrobiota bacterium]